MAASVTPLQIDDNEYGSDFSSDEERLVNSLLDQVSTPAKSQGKHAAISVATSPLAGLGVGSVAAKPTPTRGLWPSASGANRPPYTAPVVTAVISPTTRVTRSVTKAAAIRLPLDPAAIEAELAAAIAADVTIDGSLLPEDANDLGAALDPALASAFGDPVATSSSSSKRGARSPLSHQDVRPADGGRNRSRGSDSSGANWLESASWATTTWAQKSSKVWSAKGGASVSAKGEPGGVLYPDLSRALGKVDGTSDLLKSDNAAEAEEPVRDGEAVDAESAVPERPADTRTPIQRFRTYPRKPLTVTDLAAGAWCELQYLYTLTRLPGGRRTRTPAMIQGSKIHERLELETHGEAVQVDVVTKEDAFGLKLWNLVQALRTLRDTGLTREVEVWGMVEDNLVNGVIDVLSYESPDPESEEEVLSSQRYSGREGQDEGDAALDVNRSRKITDFFVPVDAFRTSAYPSASTSTRKAGSDDADEQSKRLAAHLAPKVYIKDIKTRASERKPNGAALRPTKIQLFLYHKFLGEMASGQLDFLRVFRRYGLDPDASFSDGFLAQIGELHDEVFFDSRSRVAANSISTDARSRSDSQSTVSGLIASTPGSFPIEKPERPTSTRQSAAPAPDQILDLVRYPTLRSLLSLVTSELRETFPLGAASLGTLLTVEYRMRNSDPPGRVIGEWHFPFDGARLGDYLSDYMKWWLGERRAARGVDVEESYKCRICEFAEDCEWRRKMEAKLSRGNGMGSVGAAEHGSRAGSSKGEHANEV